MMNMGYTGGDKEETVQISVCDKRVGFEQNCDISLPDYEQEVRRLLRVGVTVLPPTPYVGGGNAEFGGEVRFDILYSSPEGRLCSVSHREKYQVSAPLDKESPIDYSGEIAAFCDVEPESVISRALAPRRLSVKCRMRAHIRAWGDFLLTEKSTGVGDTAAMERLVKKTPCARVCRSSPEAFEAEYSVGLPAGWADNVRLVWGDARISLPEATAFEGGVNARGEMYVRALVERENGEEGEMPLLLTGRTPLTMSLEASCFHPGTKCRARGVCESAELSLSEGNAVWNVRGQWLAEGMEQRKFEYTEDGFSTKNSCRCGFTPLSFLRPGAIAVGNFTQSLYENASAFRVPEDSAVVDVFAEGAVEEMTQSKGKWAAAGQTKAVILLKTGEEYQTAEVAVPFRYEFEGETGGGEAFSAQVQMLSSRGKIENGKLALDMEMEISLSLCHQKEVSALQEVDFGEAYPAEPWGLICFPEKGDTLWEVAKRYHVSPEELRRLNGLTEKDASLGQFLMIRE